MKSNRIIKNIVARQHVGDSNLKVIRAVILRLKKGRKTFLEMEKKNRRDLMEAIMYYHETNQEFYNGI